MKNKETFEYDGVEIVLNKAKNLINLNQLWKAVKKPKNKDPRSWIGLDSSAQFLFALEKKLNVGLNHILTTRRGRNGGTLGHWQVALAYAKYLDPTLHIQVNEWAKSYLEEERDPEKGVKRAIKNWKRQGKSDDWIQDRFNGIQGYKQHTSTLKSHGVKQEGRRNGYADCADAINIEILGCRSKEAKSRLGLKKSEPLRDNLVRVQLTALSLIEAMSDDDIETNGLYGNDACRQACTNAGRKVASVTDSKTKISAITANSRFKR